MKTNFDTETLKTAEYRDWLLGKVMLTKNPLKFDERFHNELIDGKKTVTFRRHAADRNIGDCFVIRRHVFRVTDITPINLETFIHRYYRNDGFESVPQAQEYFIGLYGIDAEPDTPDKQRTCYPPTEFRKIDGYKIDFTKLKDV